IYDWFVSNDAKTELTKDPIGFGRNLLDAARAYSRFLKGCSPAGTPEQGVLNMRYLGGRAFKQHFILLLAGRKLPPPLFSRLSLEVEKLVFLWLITRTPTKDYERAIVEAASRVRRVRTSEELERLFHDVLEPIRSNLSHLFGTAMMQMRTSDMPAYRVRYVLAKLTQHFDVLAYGSTGGHGRLETYMEGRNDIEHILPNGVTPEGLGEFGEAAAELDLIQALGNLCLAEEAVNRALSNKPYSAKALVYPSSQFLLTKCQASRPVVGVTDRITKVASSIPAFPAWQRTDIEARQRFLAETARSVWGVPAPEAVSALAEPAQ
ncbi:MAG: HNH endonuclease family protein, partial [Pirellulales bacterium]